MTQARGTPEVRRPLSHITAPRNWLNDPNGLVRHRGRWHVFYQHNPAAPRWGAPWWGHVSSDDLVHWEDHPPALRPRPDGPDRDGCWSGCVRVVDGVPTAFYTGVVGEGAERVEAVCVATGDDRLETWVQHERPIVAAPPPGLGTGYHRDPFLFGSPGAWRMLIGSGLGPEQGNGGAILHYRSRDLRSWSYEGVLWHRPRGLGPIDTGPLWECPQLVRIGDDDVLVLSVNFEGEPEQLRYCVAAVGRLSEDEFRPRSISRLDLGDVFYAPAVLEDGSGRVLVWGWAQERHHREEVDHAGALSLPRVLSLRDGRPCLRPAAELAGARSVSTRVASLQGGVLAVSDAIGGGSSFEVEATLTAEGTGLSLVAEAGEVACDVSFDAASQTAVVLGPGLAPVRVPLADDDRTRLQVRLFVDGSLVELFLGDSGAVTTRLYGTAPAGLGARGDVGAVTLHRMGDAFPGRTDPSVRRASSPG